MNSQALLEPPAAAASGRAIPAPFPPTADVLDHCQTVSGARRNSIQI